ncbi:MAG: hypothetical protein OWQ54_04060 [Sulfolobaceae archaeon]|nr:hypothetical protein [Sulfolobaceae archaeon]
MNNLLELLLNPPTNLSLTTILLFSYLLGILHGITPDEHTWPITFSYAIGKYSTKGGMKAGFLFSLGFTLQRSFLTTIGYLGLAYFYQKYNLDGPVYIVVGIVMAIAGSYILKGKYLHIPIDELLRRRKSAQTENIRDIPLKMTIIHGLIAGFGFGAYASIITFILAPQVGSLYFAPLPGMFFGLGTMTMQIILGAFFGNLMRFKGLNEEQMKSLASKAAGRTLYYGGIAFTIAGLLILGFPIIDNLSIPTGLIIPNLDAIDIGFLLVISVVGIIGVYSIIKSYLEFKRS